VMESRPTRAIVPSIKAPAAGSHVARVGIGVSNTDSNYLNRSGSFEISGSLSHGDTPYQLSGRFAQDC
jgi:hypothetical protein